MANGQLGSLKVACYYCNKYGHIANDCPDNEKYLTETNTFYAYELSTLYAVMTGRNFEEENTKQQTL